MTTRTIRVRIGCIPVLVFLGLTLATLYWLGIGALWIFTSALVAITEIGAGPP